MLPRIFFLLAATILIIPSGNTQQAPLLTQYMFNNIVYNPAFTGLGGGICANGLIREQYFGYKDAEGNKVSPETIFLTVDSPIKALHGGVGGAIFQDKLGFFRNIGVKLGYAFHTGWGEGDFSAGIHVGLQSARWDYSKFKPVNEDPLLSEAEEPTDMIFDISAGVFYRVPDKFYIGLSGDQFIQSYGKNTHYRLKRQFFLTGGYNWLLPNHPAFELQPSVLLMYDGAAFQFNVSALLQYNRKFYGGLGYRIQDAVMILAGMTIKNFRIGLSYDISTSKLSRYNNGSFEVMVGYCFKIETDKFRKTYRNTRFL